MNYYIGKTDEIPTDKPMIIDINGVSIGVVKKSGKYYAMRNLCPHRLAPLCKGTIDGTMIPSKPKELKFAMEDQVIRCPWHGWEFDLETGHALFGISSRKATVYPVEVKNNEVYVVMKGKK